MNIAVTYEPAADEVAGVVRNHARATLRQTWIASGVTLVLAIVAAVLQIWALAVVALIVCAFSLLIIRAASRSYARLGNHLAAKTSLKLTDDGYSYTIDGETGSYTWAASRVKDGPAHWTFSVANRAMIVLPKSVLRQNARAQFEKFLSAQPGKLVRKVRR